MILYVEGNFQFRNQYFNLITKYHKQSRLEYQQEKKKNNFLTPSAMHKEKQTSKRRESIKRLCFNSIFLFCQVLLLSLS